MDVERTPVRRDGFRFQEMEAESLLFNETTKRTVYLNESATVIWKLCDGNRSVRDIIDLLEQAYAGTQHDFRADVVEAIERLLHEGAVKWLLIQAPR